MFWLHCTFIGIPKSSRDAYPLVAVMFPWCPKSLSKYLKRIIHPIQQAGSDWNKPLHVCRIVKYSSNVKKMSDSRET